LRILLDVNILVRANEKAQGLPRRLLTQLIEQGHTLLVSNEMLTELAGVLRYPRLQALYRLTEDEIYDYILFLQQSSEIVILDRLLSVPIRDPKDISVLQTAIIGEANIICTLDSDFYAVETRTFCAALKIEICTDLELAGRIKP
jgi:putative PIN family toxin of toxin-antitoxin system